MKIMPQDVKLGDWIHYLQEVGKDFRDLSGSVTEIKGSDDGDVVVTLSSQSGERQFSLNPSVPVQVTRPLE